MSRKKPKKPAKRVRTVPQNCQPLENQEARTRVTNMIHHLVHSSIIVGSLSQKIQDSNGNYRPSETELKAACWLHDNGVIAPGLVPPSVTETLGELFKSNLEPIKSEQTEEDAKEDAEDQPVNNERIW